MSAGRAELTNVQTAGAGAKYKYGDCDECGARLHFTLEATATQPTVYEEASIVLRCGCGAQSQYTVTP